MRALRWSAALAMVAWVGAVVAEQVRPGVAPSWMGWTPYGCFVVLAVAEAVRRARSGAHPVRRTLGPGVQGLGEVQDIALGRPTGLTVSYGSELPPVAELVDTRPDPLQARRWVLHPRADGGTDVTIDDGRRPDGDGSISA